MRSTTLALACASLAGFSHAIGCPYMTGNTPNLAARDEQPHPGANDPRGPIANHEVDDNGKVMTSDVGGPIGEQFSLKAGLRGPTLLEDFIFRQKIQHFDHERVPERAVHARGAGAYGTFTSYANWGNITAANFLSSAGKKTPVFLRFSTVAGSRGSADAVRDVHGFALRFYTEEGNLDIVGNNIPVFFIQDAIRFPDLIHAVKPQPDREIPQAATAHDTAWDFFGSQPSSMHTLFWAMSGHGIPRSYRHIDGFGVNTFRFVTEDGKSRYVKFHFKTQQGLAPLVWEEAQVLNGKNPDAHREDLYNAIASGNGPEWEMSVQVIEEADALKYGFDLLDATKIIPVERVPLQPIGKFKLDRAPVNYFAEVEQAMFQPGHVVRGIDFSEDPLLQGRLYSYLDTQLNRNNGPNFEQIPVNAPRVPVHNNNRDGYAQMLIHKNQFAYTPSALNGGFPAQANKTHNRGFFTAPDRTATGNLVRELPNTFDDHWSQPRLFYNSLTRAEQQFVVNAMRFELSKCESKVVRQNALRNINRISHELAVRVARALGVDAPAADPTYYHNNRTAGVSMLAQKLPTVRGLNVGILSTRSDLPQASSLKQALAAQGINVKIVAEQLVDRVDQTYAAADATAFDGIVMTTQARNLLRPDAGMSLYPAGRPGQIILDGYRWGKPIGGVGEAGPAVATFVGAKPNAPGVYTGSNPASFVNMMVEGLKTFKFVDRFPTDPDAEKPASASPTAA